MHSQIFNGALVLNDRLKGLVLKDDVEASEDEKKIYEVQLAVRALVNFVVTAFEELGIDKLHELTNPSLDELSLIVTELDAKATKINALNLKQILLSAQIMITDIKLKNADSCKCSSGFLRNANVFSNEDP